MRLGGPLEQVPVSGYPYPRTLGSVMATTGGRRQYPVHQLGTHEDFTVTVTITPRRPAAATHAFSLPSVREIPPVLRPGTFDSTW